MFVATSHLISFFFTDTATTDIYTLSLHDALPISGRPPVARLRRHPALGRDRAGARARRGGRARAGRAAAPRAVERSEEHTSELQSRQYLVCRLLLEKKKRKKTNHRFLQIQEMTQT